MHQALILSKILGDWGTIDSDRMVWLIFSFGKSSLYKQQHSCHKLRRILLYKIHEVMELKLLFDFLA